MGYLSCKAESSVATSSSVHRNRHHRRNPAAGTIQKFDFADLETATEGFSPSTLIGRGSHASVYRAVLSGGELVAVKVPNSAALRHHNHCSSSPAAADNELRILSRLRHPNMVNLLGFSPSGGLLVVEYMSNGTLYEILHRSNETSLLPGWSRRVSLALQTAKAVDALHSQSPSVIHRDIKSANILIDASWNARLGDFGLALVDDGDAEDGGLARFTPPAGTIGYLDPGYVTPDGLSTKTDVFSFGILLLEMISGREAIDVSCSPPSVVDWAIPLIRRGRFSAIFDPRIGPLKDPAVMRQLAVIAAHCVRSSKERRPAMREVAEWLKEASRRMPNHIWDSLARKFPPIRQDLMGNLNPCSTVDVVSMVSRKGDESRGRRIVGVAGKRGNSTRVGDEEVEKMGRSGNSMTLMKDKHDEKNSTTITTLVRDVSKDRKIEKSNVDVKIVVMRDLEKAGSSQPSRQSSGVFQLAREQALEGLQRSRLESGK